ncbi:MAG: PQQ-binding-like beta-propeller repeat protein, partial [Gemmataceae bacterium]|nr:PQQ-binding-like beta-propeller repeat protein [Gemmataceae bacterium]
MGGLTEGIGGCPAVVPVLIGPLQVLLTILPGLLLALGGGVLALLKPSGMKNALRLLWQQRLAVFCVLLVGAALYFGTRLLWPTGQADTVTASQSGADWPMARFDLRRCGVAPGSRSPTRAQLVWSYQQGREWYLASPAVVGNRLYIATADVRLSKSGAILCLDADTGAPVWTSSVPDYRPTFSSPVVVGDYLVIGEGLHDTRDARVICLDRRDSEKGKVVWTFRTANHVECTPVVANGRVYVGAGDDGVYCLDLQPDADGQAKVHWHKSPDQFRDAETSLAVHDGKVYVGLGNDGKALVVLDALSGAELHRIDMPYPVFSPAAIADGKLYLGMGEGDYVKDGDGGAVVCLDLARLTSDWTFALPKTVLGAVAIKDDRLYFGCGDGQLYCLSRAGKLIKAFDTRAPIKTSPAVTDEHVFVVNSAGVLYALDRHSLEPVWDYRLAASDLFISSPVVARGHVYVGTQAEGLVCVGQPPTTQRTPQWAAPLGGAGVAGNSDGSSLPDEGEIHWVYGGGRGAKVAAPVAVWENHLYVPLADTDRPGIDCLPLPKERREPPQALWHFRTDAGVWSSPVVLGKVVGAVDGRPGETRTLYLMDRDWGVLVARQPVAAEATGLLTTTGHQFLVQDQADVLTSLDPAGRRQWNAVVG